MELYPLTMCYFRERTQKCTKLFFNHYLIFILFCFYVITKERLYIEFIALNCSINQKTHNNMSINVFHCLTKNGQLGDTHIEVVICFSGKGASLRSCSPSSFFRAIQISRLPWYILWRWWQSLCNKKHRQTCTVFFLRSILLLILMILLHFDMIWFDLFE